MKLLLLGMQQYLSLVQEILDKGEKHEDRSSVGNISIFGAMRKYDLRDGFPLVTTKKVNFRNIIAELLWFLKGSTNINDGLKQYTSIWDPWADPTGELGPIYGYQWRKWEEFKWDDKTATYQKNHIDQIAHIIEVIKILATGQNHPEARRLIVSAWNVADIPKMALPPCHAFFQFHVSNGRLDLILYQRSADVAIGVPYNIASYAVLLAIMAQETRLTAGVFTHMMGDAHIRSLHHIPGLQEQLSRQPYPLPSLKITPKPMAELTVDDIILENYQSHPFIKFEVNI